PRHLWRLRCPRPRRVDWAFGRHLRVAFGLICAVELKRSRRSLVSAPCSRLFAGLITDSRRVLSCKTEKAAEASPRPGGFSLTISAFRFRTFRANRVLRSEEHTSELQSRGHLVCR